MRVVDATKYQVADWSAGIGNEAGGLPIGDGAAGMVHIQSQLANLSIQLRDIKKGKESHEDLWCTKWWMDGHTKDNYPTFMNYVSFGVPNPLNGHGLPWCRICQSRGHRDKEFLYLPKVISTPTNLFCKFCKSVGHEEKDCKAYQLLKEKTVDTYLMKNEGHVQAKPAQASY